jgi:hypothetical protein
MSYVVSTNLVCTSGGHGVVPGYTVFYSNGSSFVYVLGVNATSLPPTVVPLPWFAYVPVIILVYSIAIALLLVFNKTVFRLAVIVLSVIGLVVVSGFGALPYVPVVVNCPLVGSSTYVRTVISVLNPYYPLYYIDYVILISIILVAVAIEIITRIGALLRVRTYE